MATTGELTQAHIEAEARLRLITAAAVAQAWSDLGSYDEEDVPIFLGRALPLVLAAQRASILLTTAYLARTVERPAANVDVPKLIAGLRNGTPPETVYRRPFVSVWTDLKEHRPYDDAVRKAQARAESAAAMDVRLAMTHTLRDVGRREDIIVGYKRVPDPGACPYCVLIAGRRYLTEELQPGHPHCGCSVAPILESERGQFTGKRENDLRITGNGLTVAVREHGELGPLLMDASHDFTFEDDFS